MKEQKVTVEEMDKNKAIENLIIGWGIPNFLKANEANIIFKFDDAVLTDTSEKDYHCIDGNVKFCIYDEKLGKVLFSMEFYKTGTNISRLLNEPKGSIRLQLLYVHVDELRNNGVASYYLGKLIEYATGKVGCIKVKANANDKSFKGNKVNALSQNKLEDFYLKRSTPEMPIVLDI